MTQKYLSELFFQRIDEAEKINIDKDKRKSAGLFYNKLNISKGDSILKKKCYNNKKIKDLSYFKSDNINDNDFSSKSSDNNKNNNQSNNYSNNNYENYNNKYYKNNNKIKEEDNFLFSNKSINYRKRRKSIEMNFSKNSSKGTNKSNLEKLNNKLKNIISYKNKSNNNNSSFCPFNSPKINNFIGENLKNSSYKQKKFNKSQKLNKDMTNIELNNKNGTKTGYEDKNNEINEDNEIKNTQFQFFKNKGLNNSAIITRFRLKGSLFGMKDYIYSFFIKSIRKEYKYLSKEFSAIFNFLSDIYDITSYLQLYKQFHILSGFLLDNVANIDLNHKININNKQLFEQIALKNKNIFYFALKEQFKNISNK